MTGFGQAIAGFLATTAVAAGGIFAADSGQPVRPPTAVVVDAAAARDGRDLVDPRLRAVDAEVRLPRTTAEARTNVRYFAAQGYRLVVAGPRARRAAREARLAATAAPDLVGALAAAER
jgi:hypothetical protein